MTKEKNKETTRQTKAGMMSENDSHTASGEKETVAKNDSEHTPKISKKEAENHNGGDRPIH